MAIERAILVGCVAGKRGSPAPARELYTTPLFAKRRAYAEAEGCDWFVLSARHGLLHPDELVHPYEEQLTRAKVSDLAFKLRPHLGRFSVGTTLEIHAGVHYVDAVTRCVRWYPSLEISTPLKGMGIGEQLGWYTRRADPQLQLGGNYGN